MKRQRFGVYFMFIDFCSIIVVKCNMKRHIRDLSVIQMKTTARLLDAATIEGKGSAALTESISILIALEIENI